MVNDTRLRVSCSRKVSNHAMAQRFFTNEKKPLTFSCQSMKILKAPFNYRWNSEGKNYETHTHCRLRLCCAAEYRLHFDQVDDKKQYQFQRLCRHREDRRKTPARRRSAECRRVGEKHQSLRLLSFPEKPGGFFTGAFSASSLIFRQC